MAANRETFIEEFEIQKNLLHTADEIILYGESVMMPVMKEVVREVGIRNDYIIRCFDRGKYLDKKEDNPGLSRVIILCGMRKKTRMSMEKDSAEYFPGVPCFDFFALYFYWLTECLHRNCNAEELAATLVTVRENKEIPNIDYVTTTFCTLNCKECSNGISHRVHKEYVDIYSQLECLKKISNTIPVFQCNIQGGEALLDDHLPELLLKMAENSKVALITLATNGTILPDEGVMLALRKVGAMVRISDYGDLSKEKENICKRCEEYGVPCFLYPRSETWLSLGEFCSRERSDEENYNISEQCFFGTKDIMLFDGRLYCCMRTLYANAIQFENEDVLSNIMDARDDFSLEQLETIIYGKNLYRMCDYCEFPMKKIIPAEQFKKKANPY